MFVICLLVLFVHNLVITVTGTDLPTLRGNFDVHDPSLVQASNGKWLLYSTHNGMEARESDDLRTWTRPSADSAAFKFPGLDWANKWTKDKNEFWAPDVSGPYNGKYWLYYSVPGTKIKGSTHTAAIGVATSSTGRAGTWQDIGMVLSSKDTDQFNAIDPNLFVDPVSGKWLLTYGSFWNGIFQVEVSPTTGKRKDKSTPINLARGPKLDGEAPFIYQRGSWYYLFVSWGLCCRGKNSTYSIHFGRARSPTGPFVDRSGKAMRDGGGTLLLGSSGNQIGPGGQSVVAVNKGKSNQKDLLVYHYYDGNRNGAATLGLKYLDWTGDGWPYLK